MPRANARSRRARAAAGVARGLLLMLGVSVFSAALPVAAETGSQFVTASFEPALSANGWSASPVVVTLACDRSEQDCAVFYSINGEEVETEYTGPFTLQDEGRYDIVARAHVPQASRPRTTFFVGIDTTPPAPSFTKTCATTGAEGWCLDSATLTAALAEDSGSRATLVCYEDGATVPCEGACAAACAWTVTREGITLAYANASDEAGNSASLLQTVKVDAGAPTPASLACTAGASGWCRALAQLTTGSDAGSGLASQTCHLGAVETDCASRTVADQGVLVFRASATDVAGRSASREPSTLRVDATPPDVTIDVSCPAEGAEGWCLAPFTYAMGATDEGSGLDEAGARCTLDGAAAPCAGEVSAVGAHVLAVSATDVAGNTGERSLAMGVDLAAPELTLTQACDEEGADGWCLDGLTISLRASDDASSVTTSCSVDGGEPDDCDALGEEPVEEFVLFVETEEEPALLVGPLSEGVHELNASAKDAAGRVTNASATYRLDTKPPVLDAHLACDAPGEDGWCPGPVTLTVTATDEASGLASLACRVGDAAAPCVLPHAQAGRVHLHAEAVDHAGHLAEMDVEFGIDAQPPTATVTLVTEAPLAEDGWYLGAVRARIEASDALSGVDRIEYSLDSGRWREGVDVWMPGGAHTIAARAFDRAGNVVTTEALLVRVDDEESPFVRDDHDVVLRPGDDTGETRILFFFNEPMDRDSTQAALEDAEGWTLSWGADDLWLNLTRDDLPEGSEASVTLGTGALARHGGALAWPATRSTLARGAHEYAFAPTPFDFVDLSEVGTDLEIYCDDCGASVDLPFPFTFFGETYTSANVSSNGFLTFGDDECIWEYDPGLLPDTCATNLIAAYWEDLDTRPGGPERMDRKPDRILAATLGEAPHRTFVVSWIVVHHYYQTTPTVTFQIKLFEGSDVIEVHHADARSDGDRHLVGVMNANRTRHLTYLNADTDLVKHAVRFNGPAVDPTPPSLTYALTPPANDLGWHEAETVLTLATDADATTSASIDGGPFVEGAVFTLAPATPDVVRVVSLRAVDADGNVAELGPFEVRIDAVPPTATASGDAIVSDAKALVTLAFSEPMERASTEAALSGADGWTRSWNAESTVLTLANDTLSIGTHNLTLGTGARDAHGLRLAQPVAYNVTRPAPPADPPAPPPPPPPSPPGAPTGLLVRLDGTTAHLQWDPSPTADDAPVTAYRVHVDGALVQEFTATSFTSGPLARGAVHTFQVFAVNRAGEGPPALVTAGVPPVSTLVAPEPGAAGWHTSVPTVEFQVDPPAAQVLYDLGAGELPYAGPFPLPPGLTVLRWSARTDETQEAARAQTFRVDAAPPIIGAVRLDALAIEAEVTDEDSGVEDVVAILTPRGPGDALHVPLPRDADGRYRATLAPPEGQFDVLVRARDVAGHEATAPAGVVGSLAPDVVPEEEIEPEEASQGGAPSGGFPLQQASTGSTGDAGSPPQDGGEPGVQEPTPAQTTPAARADDAPPPPPPAIVIFQPDGVGAPVGAGARGVVTIRIDNVDDLTGIFVVVTEETGVQRILSEATRVTTWDTTTVSDGYYTLEVRRRPTPPAPGELAIASSHASGETLAFLRILVRNPVQQPEVVAGAVVGGVLVAATAHAGLSAVSSGASSAASSSLAGAGGGFDPLGFAQEVVIDAGQDKLRDKTKEKAALDRRRRIRSSIAAGLSLLILAGLWAFSETEGWDLQAWLVALPIAGAAAAVVTLMKFAAESGLAYVTRARPRIRLWVAGTISLAISSIVLRNPFGYPGYVDEVGESEERSTWRMQGLRGLSTVAGSAAFLLPFLAVSSVLPWDFVSIGLLIAVTNVATAAMPFGPLPGRDVWRWKKWAAVLLALSGFAIYVAYAAALAPMWSLWVLSIGGGLAFGASILYFRRVMPRPVRVPVEVPVPVEHAVPVRDADAPGPAPAPPAADAPAKER